MMPDRDLDDLLNRLGDRLTRRRNNRVCPRPMDLGVLESLARSRLNARDAARTRRHLETCLYCLHAYIELQGARRDAEAALDESAQARTPSSRTMQVAASISAPRDLRGQVEVLLSEMTRLMRQFRHRVVQQAYSDPRLAEEAYAAESISMASGAKGSASRMDPGDILDTLIWTERQLHERLETVRQVKDLVERSEIFLGRLRRASLSETTRSELAVRLVEERELLVAAIRSSLSGVPR
jgi:hypothetical protein